MNGQNLRDKKTNSLRKPQSEIDENFSNIIRTCPDVKNSTKQMLNRKTVPYVLRKKLPNPDRAGKEYIISAWYEKTLSYHPKTKDKTDSMTNKRFAMKTHEPHNRLCHGEKSGLRGSIPKH